MIRLFMLVLAVLSLSQGLRAQWVMANSNTQVTLRGLAFVDSQIGFAVGNEGTILKTTNGGMDWNAVWQYPQLHFLSVAVLPNGSVLAKAEKGASKLFLVRSLDVGATWEVDSTSYPYIGGADDRLHVIGNEVVMIANWDYTLVRGSWGAWNNGRTYSYGIRFTDSLNGILLKDDFNGSVRTTDGGATWTAHSLNLNPAVFSNNQILLGFSPPLPGESLGFIWYDYPPGILVTQDGAQSWENFQHSAQAILPLSQGKVLLVGLSGILQLDYQNDWVDTLLAGGFTGRCLALRPDSALVVAGDQGKIYVLPSLDLILGLEAGEMDAGSSLRVIPNPTCDWLECKLASKQRLDSLSLVDISGKTLLKSGKGQSRLDISGISNGIYFLVVDAEGMRRISRVRIQCH